LNYGERAYRFRSLIFHFPPQTLIPYRLASFPPVIREIASILEIGEG